MTKQYIKISEEYKIYEYELDMNDGDHRTYVKFLKSSDIKSVYMINCERNTVIACLNYYTDENGFYIEYDKRLYPLFSIDI